jgi:glutathione S-transferase
MTDYTLHYWPIPFRGHFVRFALAQAGVSWDEAMVDPAGADYPFVAQPLLTDHATGRQLSQTPAILMYLGRTHGLIAEPDETLRLICDAMDVLYEITRYHGAQMWDRPAWDAFTGDRLPRWMQVHERIVVAGGVRADAGFLFGADTPTLADLTLAALWHTMVDKLPGLRPLLQHNAPTVEALVDRIAARPEIATIRADWPDMRYCGGQIEASLREMLEDGR